MKPCPQSLNLRPATHEDAEIIFSWRNHPAIAALGTQNRTVSWGEHKEWFLRAINGNDRKIFIINLDNVPIGSVRFDNRESLDAEVSIYLLPGNEGKGVGLLALNNACQQVCQSGWAHRIIAHILKDNKHSLSAFRKAGFVDASELNFDSRHFTMSWNPNAIVPHNRLTFGLREEQAVADAVHSSEWAGGRYVKNLEARFSSLSDFKYAMAVSSGMSALRLALLGLRLGPGDAVAVPAYSCVALPNAVMSCGAIPIPVDVEPDTWNLSPEALRLAIIREPRLRAVIAVHTFGFPADMKALKACGLPIIEDCSHGFDGKTMGRDGQLGILSMYATKLIGAGQGGIILTNDSSAASTISDACDYVDKPAAAWRLRETMSAMEAALALCQLERLPEFTAQRKHLAAKYNAAFENTHLRLPKDHQNRVWYRYVIHTDNPDLMIENLTSHNIQAAIPISNWLSGEQQLSLPNSADAYTHLLSIPLFPSLGEIEQNRVISAVQKLSSET